MVCAAATMRLLAPPAPGLARHVPCPCPCGGALGCWLADTSCCSLRDAQGRGRVSRGVSTPYSWRTHDLSVSPWEALGQGPWDHKTCLPCWLRKLFSPERRERCFSFPISRLSFLRVFCTRRLCWSCWGDALQDRERVPGCFPNSCDWVSVSGTSPEERFRNHHIWRNHLDAECEGHSPPVLGVPSLLQKLGFSSLVDLILHI